ncbi:MAG: ABC transporter substrate-binding protein [Pseudomonadota bacterium]|jgi:ABC-type branched-subunit amino acid transport system substrate-binding protein
MKFPIRGVMALLAIGALLGSAARAESGVAPTSVLLGQSVVLSGPLAENGIYYTKGISLYLDQVNAKGGVHGRRIELRTLDDAYDPQRTTQNTRKLIEEDRVFALFGYAGTGSTLAAQPLAEKAGVPLVAPYTGADALRARTSPVTFHVRAGYGDEMLKIVEQLVTVGVKDIAVAYQDDNFGQAGLKSAEEALNKFKLQAVARGAIAPPNYDAAQAARTVAQAKPGAVILATAGKASVSFVREYLKTGERTQFFGLSVVSSAQLVKELGADAAGIAIAQVVPSPWSSKYAVVRQYRQALAASQDQQEPHHASLEGYIAAKILVEALNRAGRDLTRDKFIAALESMRNYDLGDFTVDFARNKHSGSSYVDLSIVRLSGQIAQ